MIWKKLFPTKALPPCQSFCGTEFPLWGSGWASWRSGNTKEVVPLSSHGHGRIGERFSIFGLNMGGHFDTPGYCFRNIGFVKHPATCGASLSLLLDTGITRLLGKQTAWGFLSVCVWSKQTLFRSALVPLSGKAGTPTDLGFGVILEVD